jgi:hypothetical protein
MCYPVGDSLAVRAGCSRKVLSSVQQSCSQYFSPKGLVEIVVVVAAAVAAAVVVD